MYRLSPFFLTLSATLLSVAALISSCSQSRQQPLHPDVENALKQLDEELELRHSYTADHEKHIRTARAKLEAASTAADSLGLCRRLDSLNYFFNTDSARHYINLSIRLARRLGQTDTVNVLQCRKAVLYALSGWPWEGIDLLDTLRSQTVTPAGLRQIYGAYYDIYDFFYAYQLPPDLQTRDQFFTNSIKDSLLKYEQTDRQRLTRLNYTERSLEEIAGRLIKELRTAKNDNVRGTIAIVLSNKYQQMSNKKLRDYYWARSAAYFIRSARMDNEGLIRLAQLMYDEGDKERAARYAAVALEQATRYGGRTRKLELVDLTERLRRESAEAADTRRTYLIFASCAAIFFALLLAAASCIIYRLWRRKENMAAQSTRQLAEERHDRLALEGRAQAQEEATTNFLTLCIDTIFEMGTFRHYVLRRIKAGEAAQLQKQLDADSHTHNRGMIALLRIFDVAFTRLYPDFEREVNRLLRPECQITPQEGELMNNELRILALLRVGIANSQRIGTILGLSVNTVYYYRNRLKGKAIDRDSFEDCVMKIGK